MAHLAWRNRKRPDEQQGSSIRIRRRRCNNAIGERLLYYRSDKTLLHHRDRLSADGSACIRISPASSFKHHYHRRHRLRLITVHACSIVIFSCVNFILFLAILVFGERELFTFAIMLSPVRLSFACRLSVTPVHPTQAVDIFCNIFTAFGTLATHWHSQKNLRRSSKGNPSGGRVKRNRGSQIERRWTYRRLYLWKGTR